MPTRKSTAKSYTFTGKDIMDKLNQLFKEGNIRRIIVKDSTGKSVAEFPVTVGVVGAVAAPVLAAVGVFVALLSECSITVEKKS